MSPLLALGAMTVCFSTVATAAEATYRYYRFNASASAAGQLQLSEFTFSLRGQKLNLNGSTGVGPSVPVTVTDNGAAGRPEGPEMLVDGNPTTKWFNGGITGVIFDFTTPVTIDAYNFATANDFMTRTPSAWGFQGSNDADAWVDLGNVSAYAPVSNSLFTYQGGFAVTRTTAPNVTDVWASPGIVASGSPVTVNYVTTGNPTSVTVNPGAATGTATATTFTPAATGVYTVAATNAISTTTARLNLKVVTANTISYRYMRFTPTAYRAANNSVQLSEFEFYNGATKLTVAGVTNPGGNNSGDGAPANIIDGVTTSKWLDFNRMPLVFDLGSTQTITSYQFATGGDEPARDPVQWTMEGSADGTNWTNVETVNTNYPSPFPRQTFSGRLPFSTTPVAPVLTWAATTNSTWDKTTANFTGPQTVFSDGVDVLFTDAASSKNVTLAAEVIPSQVTMTNTVGNDYTFGGQILRGTRTFQKSGAGQVTFSTPTAVSGGMTFTGGTVVSSVVRGLGDSQAAGRLTIDSGATLQVPATQHTQRPLTIGTATVNVAADQRLISVGTKALTGTMTKTGPGTISFYAYNGSTTSTTQQMNITEGAVEFGTDSFNQTIFGGNKLKITVTNGGILRATAGSGFGGDQVDYQTGIGQFRIEEGGRLEFTAGARSYMARGTVTTNSVAQGRFVLRGGTISTANQLENSNHPDDALRCIITTEASAQSSFITGGGTLTNNTDYTVLEVADGAATDDLVIDAIVDGGHGLIKEGAGNLVLTRNNTYSNNAGASTHKLPNGTTINAGTLTVTNLPLDATSSATGSGSVLLASGTTLAGSGTIAGSVQAGGLISPGTPITPTANLSTGPTVLVGGLVGQVDGADREDDFGGIIYGGDRLTVTGDLTITGATLNFSAIGEGATAPFYTIVKYTGNLTGTFVNPVIPSGYNLVYEATAKEIRLVSTGAPTGYAGWAAAAGLTGNDALATADPDFDGLQNLVEFVVGSSPTVPSLANAPTMSRDASGNFIFVFRRTTESASLNPGVEYSTSLTGTWTAAPAGTTTVEAGGFGAGVDRVTVTLPASLSVSGKLFARLKAVY